MPDDDLDRGLPARIAGVVYGIILGILFGSPLGFLVGARGWLLVLFVLASIWSRASPSCGSPPSSRRERANAILRFVWPGGSTPYEPTSSSEQALAARGDQAGALAAYDAAIRLRPMDPEPRFQVPEFLFNSGTPEKAARFLVQARRLSTMEHEA